MTGAAHDAAAFEYTTAQMHPDWFFEGEEFAWTDSAYPCTSRSIPVHKEPASRIPRNAIFDKYVAHLRCLRGLRATISSKEDHFNTLWWIKCAIILHNMVIDIKGGHSGTYFQDIHTALEEIVDTGIADDADHIVDGGKRGIDKGD
ncbi:hypothetical protein EST38_g13788 [Candolleomyces aberdarensis]|uniref:DDE Tnp4 domain-containing protein n=1 Tax=Candolleomyces aberdarensis TaxID=2316362 RepID=A0A4Q2D1C5_9AGAR|nr:hypothetical protein EST38_g13788 [Candolleomyces aberdarensis]